GKRLCQAKAQSGLGRKFDLPVARRSSHSPSSRTYECSDSCALTTTGDTANGRASAGAARNRYRCPFSFSSRGLAEAFSFDVVLMSFYNYRIELEGKNGSSLKSASFLRLCNGACDVRACGNRQFPVDRDRSRDCAGKSRSHLAGFGSQLLSQADRQGRSGRNDHRLRRGWRKWRSLDRFHEWAPNGDGTWLLTFID